MITNFHSQKMPKEQVPCKCISIIMPYSVFKAYKEYDLQTFLEECKYEQQKNNYEQKKNNYLDEDLKSYRDCKDETESDSNEDDDERKSDIYNDE